MQRRNLFLRDDTILGVCQALGEDFGFSPNWLRIVFAVLLLVNPPLVVASYLGLGALVLLSRLILPAPRAKRRKAAAVMEPGANNGANNDAAQTDLAAAA